MGAVQAFTQEGGLLEPDSDFFRISRESFPNTNSGAQRFGYWPSFMYDRSRPEIGYIGGAERWVSFLESDDNQYTFTANDVEVFSNNADAMAEAILLDSESSAPMHFVGLASGSTFKRKELLVAQAFNTATPVIDQCHVLDISCDFAREPQKIVQCQLPNVKFTGSAHDLYRHTLTDGIGHAAALHGSVIPRRTVAVYTGGTVGNIGLTAAEMKARTFPTKKIADHLKLQIDHEAEESYLIISHNAQTDESVLSNYRGKSHEAFALNPLDRIKRELPTVNFEPSRFSYDCMFDRDLSAVAHMAISSEDQVFKIGNREVHIKAGEEAARIGHSFQITNARMGEILDLAGFIRIATYYSSDQNTIVQVAKAKPSTMKALRRKYTPA